MPYEGMHSAQFMGLINALRTGDPTVDMLAAFMLPFLMQKTMHEVPRRVQSLLRHLFGKKKIPIRKYRRNIVYRTTQSTTNGVRMSTDEDSFNMYLLRAIQLYVHHHCQLKELDDAHLDLTLLDTSRCQQNRSNGRMTLQNRNGNQSTNSTVEMLQMCSVVEKQMENSWLNVGKHGGGEVNIMICDSTVAQQGKKQSGGSNDGGEEGGGGGNKSETRSLEIKLESSHSVDSINSFVNTAFDWYVNEIKKMENRDRYMLDVQPMGPRNSCNPQYTAYILSEEKTFDTLFNRKCHELLRVVDHFERKTGKYAIKGYPHKLGLLLTGIPGTGKTSLIKALAHRTGRHIVNVNLSHIATNGDLRKIFFNKMYQITGVNSHFMRLDFDQVIFVLEDVDAGAKEVVMDRALLAAEEEHAKAALASSPPKPQVNDPQTPAMAALGVTRRSSVLSGVDKLNLSGLLNVLDGVVESPGRIVIMTSNHPEILDPALIRPGRIDKILNLGYLEVEDILAMLGHYFPERKMSEEERARVTKCILEDDVKITPAQVEQLAMEEETLSGFLERLCVFGKEDEKKGGDRIYANFVIGSPGETKKSPHTLASEAVSSGTVASDATESSIAEERKYQLLLDGLGEEDYGDY